MNEHLVFWAQALDNTSPDHIAAKGVELSPESQRERQDAVSLVTGVVAKGDRIFDEGGTRLSVRGAEFVVEVVSFERDRAGRIAPTICYGIFDVHRSDEIASLVASGLVRFSSEIGRTIPKEEFVLLESAFALLKKKLLWKRAGKAALVCAGILALVLLLAYG